MRWVFSGVLRWALPLPCFPVRVESWIGPSVCPGQLLITPKQEARNESIPVEIIDTEIYPCPCYFVPSLLQTSKCGREGRNWGLAKRWGRWGSDLGMWCLVTCHTAPLDIVLSIYQAAFCLFVDSHGILVSYPGYRLCWFCCSRTSEVELESWVVLWTPH